MMLRKIAPALLLLGLGLTAVTGCQGGGGSGPAANTPAATRSVGSVDMEVLQGLDEFKKAEKDVEKLRDAMTKEAEAHLPKNPRDWTPKDKQWLTEKRAEEQKKENGLMEPLKERMEAAILQMSRAHQLMVVLDKRIVVYGVAEYTDEVKKAFQSKDELKLGEEVDTSKSPIGYFDQDVVRSLKVFQKMEIDVYEKQNQLRKQLEEAKAKGASPQDLQLLQQNLTLQLDAFKEQIATEMFSKVNESVKEVAEAQGLALVLDKVHVLQGGRNLTSEVVDSFLKKNAEPKGGKPVKPAPSGTPTP